MGICLSFRSNLLSLASYVSYNYHVLIEGSGYTYKVMFGDEKDYKFSNFKKKLSLRLAQACHLVELGLQIAYD